MDTEDREISDTEKEMKKRLSLSAGVMRAMAAGLYNGLFFGEMVGWMEAIAVPFIRHLKMIILPCIIVSLAAGISQLSCKTQTYRRLNQRLLSGLWAMPRIGM